MSSPCSLLGADWEQNAALGLFLKNDWWKLEWIRPVPGVTKKSGVKTKVSIAITCTGISPLSKPRFVKDKVDRVVPCRVLEEDKGKQSQVESICYIIMYVGSSQMVCDKDKDLRIRSASECLM